MSHNYRVINIPKQKGMKPIHFFFYEFNESDLENHFLFDFKAPDRALWRFENDGYHTERAFEAVQLTRKSNGLLPIPEEFRPYNETRTFIPETGPKEITVVYGKREKLDMLFDKLVGWMQKERYRVRGCICGIFIWEETLLWLNFATPQVAAGVYGKELGLKVVRGNPEEIVKWRALLKVATLNDK